MTPFLLRISDFQFWSFIALCAIVGCPILYVFQRAAGIKGDFSEWLTEEEIRTGKVYRRAKAIKRIRERRQKHTKSVMNRKPR